MNKQDIIRAGMKEILTEDFIVSHFTHENAPPGNDCLEECDVLKSNTGEYLGEHGKTKHKKCMDCWNEYIDDLILRLTAKQSSQGCVIKVEGELPSILDSNEDVISAFEYKKKLANYVKTGPLTGEG